jgi:hypothetical protein
MLSKLKNSSVVIHRFLVTPSFEQSCRFILVFNACFFVQSKMYLELGSMDWKGGAMSGAVYDGSQELGSLMSKVRITDNSSCQELCMTVVRSWAASCPR